MIRKFILLLISPFLFIFLWLLLARVVRHFYKFPMPEFMADVIDNPWRRKLQPPDETAVRHGLQSGMKVLDIGPGNGTYTVAAAKQVGPTGKVMAIDIEPRMIARVCKKANDFNVQNVEARVADVYKMPFVDNSFDAITMIAVLGEIPEPQRALTECYRVLKPGGILANSELLPDPDYKRPVTLQREVEAAGFQFEQKLGNIFIYTMRFTKPTNLN